MPYTSYTPPKPRPQKRLPPQKFAIFAISTTVVFLVFFGFNEIILNNVLITALNSPTINQLVLYNFMPAIVEIVIPTQFWMYIIFFVFNILVTAIMARALELEIGKTYLLSLLALLVSFLGYHLVLYAEVQRGTFFSEYGDFLYYLGQEDLPGTLYSMLYVGVFEKDMSLQNYVLLVFAGKILVPSFPFFRYDYIYTSFIYIPLQLLLIYLFVKPCSCMKDIEGGRVFIRSTEYEIKIGTL